MSISRVLREKWERLLGNWLLWRVDALSVANGGAKISSIYSGEEFRSKSYRNKPPPVLIGEARDTDKLMLELQKPKTNYLYRAVVEWARNDGTRGAQAARLALHERTYLAHVEGAIGYLEALWLMRKFKKQSLKTRFSAGTV